MRDGNVNYFAEAVKSPSNAVILGCLMFLSMGTGFIGGLPLVLFTMLVALGADLFLNAALSSSVTFQYGVNRRIEAERRERTRLHLLSKIQEVGNYRADPVEQIGNLFIQADSMEHQTLWREEASGYHGDYYRMRANLDNLRELAQNSGTNLSPSDIDKLDEVTLDYLRLVYALYNLHQRMRNEHDSTVEKKIKDIEETLSGTGVPLATRSQLQNSLSRLKKTLERRQQYPARATALSARLMHMSEDFNELYHRLNSDPSASTVTGFLADMTEKLSIEEELSFVTEMELSDYTTSNTVTDLNQHRRAQQAAAAKQRT